MSENSSGEIEKQTLGKLNFWPFEKSEQAGHNTLKLWAVVMLLAVIYTFFPRRLWDALPLVVPLAIGLAFFGIVMFPTMFILHRMGGPPPRLILV